MNQDFLAPFYVSDLDQGYVSRQSGDAETHRRRGIQFFWDGSNLIFRQQGKFSMRAVGPHVRDTCNQRAVRIARAIPAERARKTQREKAGKHAAAHLSVDRVYACRKHFDKMLTFPLLRNCHFFNPQNLRSAVAMDP